MMEVVEGVEPAFVVIVVALFDGLREGVLRQVKYVAAVFVVHRQLRPGRSFGRFRRIQGLTLLIRSQVVENVDGLVVVGRGDFPSFETRIRQTDSEQFLPAIIALSDQGFVRMPFQYSSLPPLTVSCPFQN